MKIECWIKINKEIIKLKLIFFKFFSKNVLQIILSEWFDSTYPIG